MSKLISVPYLSKKLDLLLRYDNVMTTRGELARELNIGQDRISKWQSGTETTERDTIPPQYFSRLLDIFNVDEFWMKSDLEFPDEPLKHLESRLEMTLRSRTARTGWQNLFLEAEISDQIAIRRLSNASFRGVVLKAPPDGFMGDRFFINEEVYIELDIIMPWAIKSNGTIAFLTLIMIDCSQISCLCPSEWYDAPAYEITKPRITLPSDPAKRALMITGPAGMQSLIAIFTEEALPDALRNELMRLDHPDLRDCLARLSQELQYRPRGGWLCLKQHCYVEQRSEQDDT